MKLLFLLSLLLVFSFNSLAQQETKDNRNVAAVGSYKITAEEFKDRYEFSPHPRSVQSLDTTLVKKEFLYTLIAEKLLAQKAKSLKLDTASDVKEQLNYLQKLFVKDALYKKEVKNKIEVTPALMSEAIQRSTEVLLVKYLYSYKKNEIIKLYAELKNGALLDSLLQNRPEAGEQKTLGRVVYGDLDSYVEDSLYNLNVNQFTSPIYTGGRWYIFKLYDKFKQPYFNTPKNTIKLKKIIKNLQAEKLENDYLFNFLHKLHIDVDRHLFRRIVDETEKYLITKKNNLNKNASSEFFNLFSDDIDKIESSLTNSELKSSFVKFKTNPETTEQFLEHLKFLDIKIDSTNINNFAPTLSAIVKNYIQSELLAREGFKKEIENNSDVNSDMKIWESYYLSQKLQREIYDSISISDHEAYEFFTKNFNDIFKPEEIDLEEIIVNDLDTISSILNKINNGTSFNEAAEQYCIVDSIKQRGGQLGYLPINKLGEIGEIAEKIKVGEVYGPVKVSQGYALIKLIDIRKSDTPQDTAFVKNKGDIISTIKKINFAKKIKNYVANLALEYGIKINQDVFNSIPILRMNTVTIRLIGFGGRMMAFPYSPLFSDWYKEYLNLQNDLVQ